MDSSSNTIAYLGWRAAIIINKLVAENHGTWESISHTFEVHRTLHVQRASQGSGSNDFDSPVNVMQKAIIATIREYDPLCSGDPVVEFPAEFSNPDFVAPMYWRVQAMNAANFALPPPESPVLEDAASSQYNPQHSINYPLSSIRGDQVDDTARPAVFNSLDNPIDLTGSMQYHNQAVPPSQDHNPARYGTQEFPPLGMPSSPQNKEQGTPHQLDSSAQDNSHGAAVYQGYEPPQYGMPGNSLFGSFRSSQNNAQEALGRPPIPPTVAPPVSGQREFFPTIKMDNEELMSQTTPTPVLNESAAVNGRPIRPLKRNHTSKNASAPAVTPNDLPSNQVILFGKNRNTGPYWSILLPSIENFKFLYNSESGKYLSRMRKRFNVRFTHERTPGGQYQAWVELPRLGPGDTFEDFNEESMKDLDAGWRFLRAWGDDCEKEIREGKPVLSLGIWGNMWENDKALGRLPVVETEPNRPPPAVISFLITNNTPSSRSDFMASGGNGRRKSNGAGGSSSRAEDEREDQRAKRARREHLSQQTSGNEEIQFRGNYTY